MYCITSEKAMAPHSSALAWKIPQMEEPGRLQSMESLRVRHDWATSLSRIGEGNGNPLQCSCLENPRDGGAWWAAICGVAQSWTWPKWISSRIANLCLVLLCFWENRCTERGHDCRSSDRYGGRSPADFPPGVAADPTERQKEIWGRRETKWNSVNVQQNPLPHLGYLSRASSIMTIQQNCPISS